MVSVQGLHMLWPSIYCAPAITWQETDCALVGNFVVSSIVPKVV